MRSLSDRIQNLLSIRHGRMLASPFAFYRGSAIVMAYDPAAGRRTSLTTQLSGDAHVGNFGLYGSPERRLVFDLNDFDETWPGPFEWDVKRLAASVELAARANDYPASRVRSIVVDVVGAYREAIRNHAHQGNLEVWYAHASAEENVSRPWLGPTPGLATGSPSPRTSVGETPSTKPSPASLPRMPTRQKPTSRPCSGLPRRAGSTRSTDV